MNLRFSRMGVVAALLSMKCLAGRVEGQEAPRLTMPVTLPALLATAGPPLQQMVAEQFQLFSELPRPQTSALLDSLKVAFVHSTNLLEAPVKRSTPVPVIITASPTRFAPLLSPSSKGFRGLLADGSSVIILVVNDSVRPYTRHEVMHDVAFKSWGLTYVGAEWMSEALATYADGRCQGVPNIVVARDLLEKNPDLTIEQLVDQFWAMSALGRHGTYVLGASVIEFLWQGFGREAVRRLWQHGEWPRDGNRGGALPPSSLTSRWRSYVSRTAGTRAGLDAERLRRHGCG